MTDLTNIFSRAWVRNLLWLLAIAAIFFGVRAWQHQAMPTHQAPEVSGITVGGKKVSLSDFRGQPVMLYFWATWCKICEFEQDSIRSIGADHRILSVAMRSGNELQVGQYMQEHNLDAPTLVDDLGDIARLYGVRGTPTAFFIDGDGKIQSIEVGYTSEIGMRVRLWLASRRLNL